MVPVALDGTAPTTFALTGARVIDGSGRTPKDHASVVVREGRIDAVLGGGPRTDVPAVDVRGRTVMPGLIDAHVHLDSVGQPGRLHDFGLVRTARDLLEAGITTVRDLGAFGTSLFDLREAARRGLCDAPTMVLAGKVLSSPCPGAKEFPGMYREAVGEDEMHRAVREQVAEGADVIKVMVTGALTVPFEDVDPPQISERELQAVVDEAHALGRPVATHAEGKEGIRRSIEAGVDTLEHGEQACLVPDVLGEMAARGIVLVPTLTVFDHVATSDAFPRWMRERGKRLGECARLTIEAALREGVAIAMGADAPPHGANARELVALADAGLSPSGAIAAATSVAARALRIDAEAGTLEPGKTADLLVVDGDPAVDVRVLADPSRIWLVLQRGRPVGGRGIHEIATSLARSGRGHSNHEFPRTSGSQREDRTE